MISHSSNWLADEIAQVPKKDKECVFIYAKATLRAESASKKRCSISKITLWVRGTPIELNLSFYLVCWLKLGQFEARALRGN